MGDCVSKSSKYNPCFCPNSVSDHNLSTPKRSSQAVKNDSGVGGGIGGGTSVKASPQTFAESLQLHQNEQKELDYLSKMTNFNERTLRMLHLRFLSIDEQIEKDSAVSIEEFSQVIGVAQTSLLAQRFFHHIDKNNFGSVTFRNFVSTMSVLSSKATKKEKLDLSFFLYDLNNDGYIDKDELTKIVTSVIDDSKKDIEYVKQTENYQVMPEFNSEHINEFVDLTFDKVDKNKDGRIDLSEYAAYCDDNPHILEPFTLDIEKLMEYEAKLRRSRRYSSSIEKKRILHHGPLESNQTNASPAAAAASASPATPHVKSQSTSHSKSLVQFKKKRNIKSKSFHNNNRNNNRVSPKFSERIMDLNPFRHSKIKVSIADMELTQIEQVTPVHNAWDITTNTDQLYDDDDDDKPRSKSTTRLKSKSADPLPNFDISLHEMSIDESQTDTNVSVVSEVKNNIGFELPFKEVAHLTYKPKPVG